MANCQYLVASFSLFNLKGLLGSCPSMRFSPVNHAIFDVDLDFDPQGNEKLL